MRRLGPIPAGMRRDEIEEVTFEIVGEIETPYPKLEPEIEAATDLVRQKRFPEAQAALENILAREPRARQAYTNLAVVYFQTGQSEAGEALLRQAVAKFPRYGFARINLARICLKRGEVDEAWRILKPGGKLLSKFYVNEFQAYILTLCDLLAYQDDFEAARAWLKLLRETMPGHPHFWRRRILYTFQGWLHRSAKR